VIPYRGSWLDFEFDAKDILFFRVDRRRKMPVTILLKALGYTPETILDDFFSKDTFYINSQGVQFELVPERLRGEIARFDICGKDDHVIVAKDKRITAKHIRELDAAGVKKWAFRLEFVVGRVLAHDVVDTNTGELVARANDEITEELLAKLTAAGVENQHPLHQRSRSRRLSFRRPCATDDTHRRVRCQGRDLSHDASGRAAHRRCGQCPVR
jgi:DNA-directed RNA polymerase subunit beta